MKKLVPEFVFDESQLHTVRCLAEQCGLTEGAVKILYGRGIDSEEKIRAFLTPSSRRYLSPFLLSGMREAVELLTRARDEGLTVAVFGDYDADGVCALSVMHFALRAFGIEPYLYVPERSEGYGLTVEAIDKIFDEVLPDLFITVDCGISNADAVLYIRECGADVIVTDHHQLPEHLPDCICINPKFEDDYPYDNLCGAGVAFKLACALIGERAYPLADFAAIASVADSVPLLGENRDIVAEGLRRINESPRPCFSALLGKQAGAANAQTLAFAIAPRINAAGRMGDAHAALSLFTSESEAEISDLAAKLCAYNTERQKNCDELYRQAKAMLKEKGVYKNVIMLADERWNTGFVGIVSARLAEEYNRPALLFVKNGNMLKGSARSIECVNIFDALRNCSQYIAEFGGHAQAAGVNVSEENFSALEDALDAYIGAHYTQEDFIPKLFVSEIVDEKFPPSFARELERFEPFGVGNKRPLFAVKVASCEATPLKPLSPHLSIENPCMEMVCFNGLKWRRLLESDVEKYLVFESNVSKFRGREYIKGIVREILYDGASGSDTGLSVFANSLARLREQTVEPETEYLGTQDMTRRIAALEAECAYGTCFIASRRETLAAYPALRRRADLFYPSDKNPVNRLLLSPSADADLSVYRNILFLDMPIDFNVASLRGKHVCVNPEIKGFSFPSSVRTDRESLLSVFAALRTNAGKLAGSNAEEVALSTEALGFDPYLFVFALNVFEELGLVAYEDERLVVYRGVRSNLNNSVIYRKAVTLNR